MVYPFSIDFYGYLPEFFLVVTISVLLLSGVFFEKIGLKQQKDRFFYTVPVLFSLAVLSLFLLFVLYLNQLSWLEFSVVVGFESLLVDRLGLFLKIFLLLLFISIFLLLRQWGYEEGDRLLQFEYPLLLLFSLLGYLLLIGSYNFLLLYLALELSSFALYILAGFNRFSIHSTESGLKYFILGAFSSGLLLFGITIIYGFSGTINFSDLMLLYNKESLPPSILFGLLLILSGLLFKLGVAPFHFWVPDVYEGAPTPVVAYFATVSKVAVFGVVFRLLYEVFPQALSLLSPILLLFGVVSVLVGTLGALFQTKIKRLIAYSGIVHSGFLLLALSTGTHLGGIASILYLVVYLLLNLNLFSTLLSKGGKLTTLSDLSPLFRVDPLSSSSFSLTLFSMAGIPPLAGFFSKLYVLLALVQVGYYGTALLVVLLSVVSSVYYLRLIKILLFELPEPPVRFGFFRSMPPAYSIVLIFSSTFNLFFIFFQTTVLFFIGTIFF